MHVLIVGLNFHPELTSTGKYTGELAACLAGSGHQVRVITTPPYYPVWKIEQGAVIGARSTVLKELPGGRICYGNPAKAVKPREKVL